MSIVEKLFNKAGIPAKAGTTNSALVVPPLSGYYLHDTSENLPADVDSPKEVFVVPPLGGLPIAGILTNLPAGLTPALRTICW